MRLQCRISPSKQDTADSVQAAGQSLNRSYSSIRQSGTASFNPLEMLSLAKQGMRPLKRCVAVVTSCKLS